MNVVIEFINQNKKKVEDLYEKMSNIGVFASIFPLLWLSIFFVFPFFIVLKISFAEATFSIPPFSNIFDFIYPDLLQIKLSFGNYEKLISDSYYREALFNSIILASTSTVGCLIVGYMVAYGISKIPGEKKSIFLLFVSLSFWTSFLIRVYAWMNLFSVRGPINSFLLDIGIISSPIHFIGNYYALCIGMIFCYLPFMIFPVYSALDRMETQYLEAAYDLGSNSYRTFWKITVPLTKNGAVAGGFLVFSASMGEFVIPELLGSADSLTIGRLLWIEFFNNLNWPMACAMSVMIFSLITAPMLCASSIKRSVDASVRGASKNK